MCSYSCLYYFLFRYGKEHCSVLDVILYLIESVLNIVCKLFVVHRKYNYTNNYNHTYYDNYIASVNRLEEGWEELEYGNNDTYCESKQLSLEGLWFH